MEAGSSTQLSPPFPYDTQPTGGIPETMANAEHIILSSYSVGSEQESLDFLFFDRRLLVVEPEISAWG